MGRYIVGIVYTRYIEDGLIDSCIDWKMGDWVEKRFERVRCIGR